MSFIIISFRYKSLQWWAQSHLTGIKEIICGLKDDKGVVKRINPMKTEELPKIAKVYSFTFNIWYEISRYPYARGNSINACIAET